MKECLLEVSGKVKSRAEARRKCVRSVEASGGRKAGVEGHRWRWEQSV